MELKGGLSFIQKSQPVISDMWNKAGSSTQSLVSDLRTSVEGSDVVHQSEAAVSHGLDVLEAIGKKAAQMMAVPIEDVDSGAAHSQAAVPARATATGFRGLFEGHGGSAHLQAIEALAETCAKRTPASSAIADQLFDIEEQLQFADEDLEFDATESLLLSESSYEQSVRPTTAFNALP